MLSRSRVTSCCRAGCVRAVPERMMSLRCCSLTLPCLAQASHEMGVPMCTLRSGLGGTDTVTTLPFHTRWACMTD